MSMFEISFNSLSARRVSLPRLVIIAGNLVLLIALLHQTGCSSLKASAAKSSPFLTHAEQLKPWYDRAPWDAVWSANPGKIMVKSEKERTIYVAPVNLQYLNMQLESQRSGGQSHTFSTEDAQTIATLMRQRFIEAIEKETKDNLALVDQPSKADLILEVALVELVPTRVWANVALDVGGVVLPGSKTVEQAAAVGAQAAGGSWSAGTIAMEFRIVDGGSSNVVAEAKDREADPSSIIPNYRDFEPLGWSRKMVGDWSVQFVEVFSTPVSSKVDRASDFSFVPW